LTKFNIHATHENQIIGAWVTWMGLGVIDGISLTCLKQLHV